LQQLRQVLADGVPPAPVLMDPAYGNDSKLRAGVSELGLSYVAGIHPTTMVWRPGEAPLPPAPRAGRGRPGTRLRRDATHRPVAAKTLALELDADAWQQIKWRDGSNTPLTSRFARWRVLSDAIGDVAQRDRARAQEGARVGYLAEGSVLEHGCGDPQGRLSVVGTTKAIPRQVMAALMTLGQDPGEKCVAVTGVV
jgi:hypothetical protein